MRGSALLGRDTQPGEQKGGRYGKGNSLRFHAATLRQPPQLVKKHQNPQNLQNLQNLQNP